jgi:hypothetical protein
VAISNKGSNVKPYQGVVLVEGDAVGVGEVDESLGDGGDEGVVEEELELPREPVAVEKTIIG